MDYVESNKNEWDKWDFDTIKLYTDNFKESKIKFSINNVRYEGEIDKFNDYYMDLKDCIRVEKHHKFKFMRVHFTNIDFFYN